MTVLWHVYGDIQRQRIRQDSDYYTIQYYTFV